ncbi:cytochrome b [Natranaeroarchaeum sulfidigenes]|uniref:Cytochrome b subunit of the bc complex n=1 Tax=Natranaeroarchaeum sulfidigenes TaxID=2784880 RepID=A0A897MW22_9EURY|nr:cytochrome b N-terminal domain-containing protein [Natranaeroarchaeum sulfidigenes]QSG03119.1 Cytochrome b subunit of the bc complex [Natranaeroarchaeum sulfidigenes]
MSLQKKDDFDHGAWLDKKELSLIEKTYLFTLMWLDKRLRIVDYLELLEDQYYKMNMQMPKSHTEQYNLDNKFWYWYPLYSLGSLSIIAYVVLAITGALLGFYYAPATAGEEASVAYNQMLFIMAELNFGYMLRSIHRWAAQFMIAAVFLHMLRVYFTGAYKEPREVNWIIGVILILLLLLFGFSGYVLPWNQLSLWAGQIGVEMAMSVPLVGEWAALLIFGGFEMGQPTLMRMYIMHVFILPFVVTALIALHVAIVWMQGIAEPH